HKDQDYQVSEVLASITDSVLEYIKKRNAKIDVAQTIAAVSAVGGDKKNAKAALVDISESVLTSGLSDNQKQETVTTLIENTMSGETVDAVFTVILDLIETLANDASPANKVES